MTVESPPTRFDDTVVVTGSTRGIGRTIAKRFARVGAAVVVTWRTREAGERIVKELRDDGHTASYLEADLRAVADIECLITETVKIYSRIDILVNNAGVQTDTSVTEVTLDDWERVVETDFQAGLAELAWTLLDRYLGPATSASPAEAEPAEEEADNGLRIRYSDGSASGRRPSGKGGALRPHDDDSHHAVTSTARDD